MLGWEANVIGAGHYPNCGFPDANREGSSDGRLDPTVFATHRFPLSDAEEVYDVFAAAAETRALEVLLNAAVPVHQQLAPARPSWLGPREIVGASPVNSELHDTARSLVDTGKGILAADESSGTIKKRFDS
ncbi:MAG: fructose-bisphosphate aldolase, partial [Actinomycetota bacterium]|nr:fructose-bisphosphate aldolase [Actinomycetota bacterium]